MPIDPRHGRSVPLGRPLARLLRIAFRQIGNSVGHAIWQGEPLPNLRQWQAFIAEHAEPLLFRTAVRSARRMLTVIGRAERTPRRRRKMFVKAPIGATILTPAPPTIQFSWQVFLQQVAEQVRVQAIQFARSTLDTAIYDAAEAYTETRAELEAGMSRGEALGRLAQRIQTVFNDPKRSFTIAATESSRASHRGEQIAAAETGVVAGWEWLASSDACPLCLKLDGKKVKAGEPFYVDPKGGPYAVVVSPPRH